MINKTLIVIYNQKTRNYTTDTADFFSLDEISFIKQLALESYYDIEFIKDELRFMNCINNYLPSEIVVLNLTRRGSTNNKKSAVTAICDLKGIATIGSSTLTMNLCRNRKYLEPLLSSIDVKYPHIIDSYTNIVPEKYYIIKNINSAGSLGMDQNSVKKGSTITRNIVPNQFIVQEYIEGYELEIPFIVTRDCIKVLGIYQIEIKGTNYFSSQDIRILDFETADNFSYEIKKIILQEDIFEKLCEQISRTVKFLKIENYGRIDYRTKNLQNIDDFYLFDIATSPFFTEHSSFLYGCPTNLFDTLLTTL